MKIQREIPATATESQREAYAKVEQRVNAQTPATLVESYDLAKTTSLTEYDRETFERVAGGHPVTQDDLDSAVASALAGLVTRYGQSWTRRTAAAALISIHERAETLDRLVEPERVIREIKVESPVDVGRRADLDFLLESVLDDDQRQRLSDFRAGRASVTR